jgi:hypothetical protein
MSLLDDLHRRVDQLSPREQVELQKWFDNHSKSDASVDELATWAQYALKATAQVWPKDDWSAECQRWKKFAMPF